MQLSDCVASAGMLRGHLAAKTDFCDLCEFRNLCNQFWFLYVGGIKNKGIITCTNV